MQQPMAAGRSGMVPTIRCGRRFALRHTLLSISALTLLAASSSGCSRFAKHAKGSDGVARPAAFREAEEREEPDVQPFALAQDDDFIVRVVAGNVTCSGALIEENQVLTAHHCVAQRGKSGEMLSHDIRPDTVRVELGGDHFAWGEVGVKAILTPPCGHAAGEGDIAILVLERTLVGVPTRAPRLDTPPTAGEPIEPVGFGRCVYSNNVIRRALRKGGEVDKVMPSRFQLLANICPGDSGGPALDAKTGEIVGVISASVMDSNEATVGRSEFTRLDAWRSLFAQAQLVSEGLSPIELPPLECAAH